MTTTQVNGYINSIEEMEALPDGAVVVNGHEARFIVRHPDGPNGYVRFERVDGDRAGRLLTSTSRTVRYDDWWTLESLPEARDTPEFPYVGAGVTAHSQWAQLPDGTVLTVPNAPDTTYRIEDHEGHKRLVAGNGSGIINPDLCHIASTRIDGGLVIQSLPEPDPAPDWLQVGTGIESNDQWRHLPPGTVLRGRTGGDSRWVVERRGDHLRLMIDGTVSNNDLCCNRDTRVDGFLIIDSLPGPAPEAQPYEAPVPVFDETVASNETPPPDTETYEEFRQRVRTVALGQARASGVSMSPVHDALQALEVTEPEVIVPGNWVFRYDLEALNVLSNDAVLVSIDSGSWYRKGGENLMWLHVGEESGGYLFRVVTAGDRGRPRPGDFRDIQRITAFKRDVWQIGYAAKGTNSWCGDFERAMIMCGITSDVPDPVPWLTAEEVRALPEGSIVEWRDLDHRLLMMRHDRAPNPSRTVPIGWNPVEAGWSSYGNQLVWRPDNGEELRIPVHSRRELAAMPTGTRMRGVNTLDWVKGENGLWSHRSHEYGPAQFVPSEMHYTHIPVD